MRIFGLPHASEEASVFKHFDHLISHVAVSCFCSVLVTATVVTAQKKFEVNFFPDHFIYLIHFVVVVSAL